LAKRTQRAVKSAKSGRRTSERSKASPRAAKAARGKAVKASPKRASRSARRVYFFGDGKADGDASMREILGGKGANLAEMVRLGVPVPAGFTISTEVCGEFYRAKQTLPAGLMDEAVAALARIERVMGGRFGDPREPLLVSVRSGSRVSMPGMMDTVLNLGLNDDTVEGLAQQTEDRRFAFDCYRRFVQMYGDVVLGVERDRFEEALSERKRLRGAELDTQLDGEDLAELVKEFKEITRAHTGRPFPSDPREQLAGAIAAVFRSWNTARAVHYRKLERIPEDWGTAVTVQAMVFGNLGDDSATGVGFTRNPSTGERAFFGEYLPKAQGEDVVAGIRTPHPIAREARGPEDEPSLEEAMPACYKELRRVAALLERHYRDMQDLEFTVQRGVLWMLQTRSGKRTARSALKIAVDMVREKLIDRDTALRRIKPEQLDQLLHPSLDRSGGVKAVARGLAASPGAAGGGIVFSADAAEARAARGEAVILVRRETSPEDIHGMHAARGILTALGGMTSHAAVVARGMGKCCVSGCGALQIDAARGIARIGGVEVREGDWITLDGGTGEIFIGVIPTREAELGGDFETLMKWADAIRKLQVRTNADTPEDAAAARRFGAEGIGLCRTEHMFFQADRLLEVRRMILADTAEERAQALEKILPMQRGDFEGIFEVMGGLPVTVRLLDPPLHEFLPHAGDDLGGLAKSLGIAESELARKVDSQREANPMLGHRGCRLGITYPEIYAVQVRAVLEAACACAERGVKSQPEIMIPLVADEKELRILRELIDQTAETVFAERKRRVRYTVGTMMEVPRAVLRAGPIAEVTEFFSFGTNDLTQMTLALSRDDAGRFIGTYVERGVFPADPFVTLDVAGVGELIRLGVRAGREVRPKLKIGICGEHGGDAASVRFCAGIGLDYVSCSPYRVPIARLAAAQAMLED
jgi:pyruvate, orthophosphate dikinase